jgi:outer membrane protein assembly factor BamB
MVADSSLRSARKFPKRSFFWLLMISSLVAMFIASLKLFSDFFNEQFNLNPGFPNVLLLISCAAGVFVWSVWLFFFARKRFAGALLLVSSIAWVVFYHPVLGGDAEILGWQPRFWVDAASRKQLDKPSDLDLHPAIDLVSTGEFDFPQFLGRSRDGIVRGVSLNADWKSSPPRRLWTRPIGEGWSGFAIVNGFAVTQEQRGEEECVVCYDLESGNPVWVYSAKRRHEDIMKLGKVGPRATPTVHDGLVYTMGGTGVLDCINGSDGTLVWSVDVAQEVGVSRVQHRNELGQTFSREDSSLEWGRSASPLIFENLVIVAGGGPVNDPQGRTATLLAFEKKTGEQIWRGGKRQIAYGSPSLAVIAGHPQVLLVAESMAVGHDPATGVELWSHERRGGSSSAANCSQATFAGGNRLLFSKGYNMGGELVELEQVQSESSSPTWRAVTLKADPRILKTKLTNPVIRDRHAYCLSDGYLECTQLYGTNPEDPSQWLVRKWKQRGRFGNGQILMIGGYLLVHSDSGELMLVAVDPIEYRLLGTVKTISGICWNTIGFYKNRVLVRSDQEMACLELALEDEAVDLTNGTPVR